LIEVRAPYSVRIKYACMSVMHLNMVFIQVLVLRTGRKALVEVDDPYLRDPESANNLSEGPSYSQ
jgi:hypothetical protein